MFFSHKATPALHFSFVSLAVFFLSNALCSAAPTPHVIPAHQPHSLPSLPSIVRDVNASATKGYVIILCTVTSTLPWAVVAVWDAIDSSYRSRLSVGIRLAASSAFLTVAYLTGMFFAAALLVNINEAEDNSRWDELATILVLLIFNLWHVSRNVRGWLQFFALFRLRPYFRFLQRRFALSFPGPASNNEEDEATMQHLDNTCATSSSSSRSPDTGQASFLPRSSRRRKYQPYIASLSALRISERLIDNDWGKNAAPFLNPIMALTPYVLETRRQVREAWSTALWRAFWTQDTKVGGVEAPGLMAPDYLECGREHRHALAQDLFVTGKLRLHWRFMRRRALRGMPVLFWANRIICRVCIVVQINQ